MQPEIKKYGSIQIPGENQFFYDASRQMNMLNGEPVVLRFNITDSTTRTDSTETGDPDEIFGTTVITESIEPADPDEIYLESTEVTAYQEQADPDEIFASSTIVTKAVEATDPDEFSPTWSLNMARKI